jgi:hypothetical protein
MLRNKIIDKTLKYATEISTLTKTDRKQLNFFLKRVIEEF